MLVGQVVGAGPADLAGPQRRDVQQQYQRQVAQVAGGSHHPADLAVHGSHGVAVKAKAMMWRFGDG
ncbi:hypothetical protein ACWDTT_22035 [Streptosporangium sandarakinum]|uniref:hypothetical protein n=1 Tax=Streptosporangium TaxID=2000 RepID=UPI0031FA4236